MQSRYQTGYGFEEQIRGGRCTGQYFRGGGDFSQHQEFDDGGDGFFRQQIRILWSHRHDPDFRYYQQQARRNLYQHDGFYEEERFGRPQIQTHSYPYQQANRYNNTINPYPHPYPYTTTYPSTYPTQAKPETNQQSKLYNNRTHHYPHTSPHTNPHVNPQTNPQNRERYIPQPNQQPNRPHEYIFEGDARLKGRPARVPPIGQDDDTKVWQYDVQKNSGVQNQDLRQTSTTNSVIKAEEGDGRLQLQKGIDEMGLEKGTLKTKTQGEEKVVKAQGGEVHCVKTQIVVAQNVGFVGRPNQVEDVGRQIRMRTLPDSRIEGCTPLAASLLKTKSTRLASQAWSTAQARMTAVDVADRQAGEPPILRFTSTGIGDFTSTTYTHKSGVLSFAPQLWKTTTEAADKAIGIWIEVIGAVSNGTMTSQRPNSRCKPCSSIKYQSKMEKDLGLECDERYGLNHRCRFIQFRLLLYDYKEELWRVEQVEVMAKAFGAVRVMSDEDVKSWLAAPFSDLYTRDRLKEWFEVREIPHLVIIEENGEFLSDSGIEIIREYEVDSVLVTISRDFVVLSDGKKVPVAVLEGKTVSLYLSLTSYKSSTVFTPKLVEGYEKLEEKGEGFEKRGIAKGFCFLGLILYEKEEPKEIIGKLGGAVAHLVTLTEGLVNCVVEKKCKRSEASIAEATMKKLRAQIREFEEEKKGLATKLQDVENKVESIKRDKTATEKLLQETIEKHQVELAAQNDYYTNDLATAKEAERLAEARANTEARTELETRLREAEERQAMLVQELEELRQTLIRKEQQAVFKEDMLRRDIEDLQKRYQASERRCEELISQVPESTRPLLRQIELVYSPVCKDGMKGLPKTIVSDIIAPADPIGWDLVIPACCDHEEIVLQKKYFGGQEGAGEYIWYRETNNGNCDRLLYNFGGDILACGLGLDGVNIVELLKEVGHVAAASRTDFAAVGVSHGTCFGFVLNVNHLSVMRSSLERSFIQSSFYWFPP